MTVEQQAITLLPTTVSPTAPLNDPSHAALHNQTNTVLMGVDTRVGVLETTMEGLTEPGGAIDQARLVANTWTVSGTLPSITGTVRKLIIPLLWNISGRNVEFEGAKLTMLTTADRAVIVNIVTGTSLTGAVYDPLTHTTILAAGKQLSIPVGARVSAKLTADDFAGVHGVDSYLAAYVEQIGTSSAPGGDLTIQLNRSL